VRSEVRFLLAPQHVSTPRSLGVWWLTPAGSCIEPVVFRLVTVLPIGQDELGQWSDEVARAGDAASWSVTGDRSRPHLAAGSIWRTNASRDASLPVVAGVFRCTVLPHGWRGVGRLNGQMVLVGGWGPSWPHVSHSEIWTSSDGQGWNRLPDAPRGGRSTHHTVVFQNRMWVMAGQEISFVDEAENEVLYNDVWSSADGREWRLETGEAAWSPRVRSVDRLSLTIACGSSAAGRTTTGVTTPISGLLVTE
jgi:hypothetical protein